MPQLSPNSSFSQIVPSLQLAMDSTSLGSLQQCPRYYQLRIVEGWASRQESVHLTWGLLFHAAMEEFHKLRSRSVPYETALEKVVHSALRATWDPVAQRPWQSNDSHKNRFTLVRAIIFYLDQYRDDPVQTLHLSSGRPAVELSFRFDSGYQTARGERWTICGHMDRIGHLHGTPWVSDYKSTKSTLSISWFDKFSPDLQFTIYTLAGKIVYHTPVNGIMVDGIQTGTPTTPPRFERQLVTQSDFHLDEWLADLEFWLSQLEYFAESQHWPQNRKACDMYGGCPFRPVCRQRSPEARSQFLAGNYVRRPWDPLQVRGDI